MFEIRTTREFDAWLEDQEKHVRALVVARLNFVSQGHFGDVKRFEGLIEIRWKNGTRVYAMRLGNTQMFILVGGSKHGQDKDKDIRRAKKIKEEILEGF